MDTRHWNIDLTFDGVHFTEAGHHTFAEKPGKELCLMESSHTPIALGKHSFPTLVMSNSGPFQDSSKDEYRIKYRFPILLASVFFAIVPTTVVSSHSGSPNLQFLPFPFLALPPFARSNSTITSKTRYS